MPAHLKFTVDYENPVDEADLGWTGVLYPAKADADWAAENLKGRRPDLRNIRVETLDLSAPRTL